MSENYNYRINLEKLKNRYENKIKELKDIKNFENLITVGIEIGLETAIQDIEDILDGLEM